MPRRSKGSPRRKAELDRLIADAILDAYNHSEQAVGFYTMIEYYVEFPVPATAVGEEVEVTKVDLDRTGEDLLAVCRRQRKSYKVQLTELECPKDFPGRDWIAAYFQFRGLVF